MFDTTQAEKPLSDRVKQRLHELAASLDLAGEHIEAANAGAAAARSSRSDPRSAELQAA